MVSFVYYNNNQLGKEEEDCVNRAIALASGYSYAEIQDKLYYISQLFECPYNCVCCYEHLLNDVFHYDKVYCKGMTVEEFAKLHPKGIYILRMNGHCSCLIDNKIYDLWNCKDEILTDVWRVD